MKTSPQTKLPVPQVPPPEPGASGATGYRQPKTTQPRRRCSKVAGLPKNTRDQINLLLQDGLSYRKILLQLGEQGKTLNEQNLSSWKNGGYQDWFLEQQWRQEIRLKLDLIQELAGDSGEANVQQASLQLAALYLFQILQRFNPANFSHNLANDPDRFFRLITLLCRLSGEALQFEKLADSSSRLRWSAPLSESDKIAGQLSNIL